MSQSFFFPVYEKEYCITPKILKKRKVANENLRIPEKRLKENEKNVSPLTQYAEVEMNSFRPKKSKKQFCSF